MGRGRFAAPHFVFLVDFLPRLRSWGQEGAKAVKNTLKYLFAMAMAVAERSVPWLSFLSFAVSQFRCFCHLQVSVNPNNPLQTEERLAACDFLAQLAHRLFKWNKLFLASRYTAAAFGQNVTMPGRRLRLGCGGQGRPQVFHRLDSLFRRHPVYCFHHCWHFMLSFG